MPTGKRPRGRPRGTTTHPEDEHVLNRAAWLLVAGYVATPTEAFRRVVDEDDEAAIRRLQRKWLASGRRRLDREVARIWEERWTHDLWSLWTNQPELYARLMVLEASPEGQAYLAEHAGPDGQPAASMSLNLKALFDRIEEWERDRRDPAATDGADLSGAHEEALFQSSLRMWRELAGRLSPRLLRSFGDRCHAIANRLDAVDALAASPQPPDPGKGDA